jgi:DNA repair exonuclease SbcCD nuclease subunit
MPRRVIHFSDFHAHIFEDFAKPDPECVNDRFRAQLETLQKVFDLAREHEAALVFGGDLFHKRGTLEDTVFNSVYRVFASNNDIDTYLLRGNHDSHNNTTNSEHWLDTFRYLPHVTVFEEPAKGYIPDVCSLYAIPYSDDVELLKTKIKEFAEHYKIDSSPAGFSDDPALLIGHIGVDGSEVGRYSHRLEGAFKLGDLYPDVFDYVALGHYHKRQFLGGTDNVFYTGNTIQTSFSDEGQEKGVMLIDFDKGGKPEFIPIQNKQFITLNHVPDNAQELVNNNYVRFVVPQEQAQAIEVFKEETDNIRVEVQKEYKIDTRIDISVDSNEQQVVKSYCAEFYPGDTETERISLEILSEASIS